MSIAKFNHHFIVIAAIFGLAGLAGCQKQGAGKADPNVDYYTCTMHPSVHSHDPKGKCPICSMDLVPVLKKGVVDAVAPKASGPMLSEFGVPVERPSSSRPKNPPSSYGE